MGAPGRRRTTSARRPRPAKRSASASRGDTLTIILTIIHIRIRPVRIAAALSGIAAALILLAPRPGRAAPQPPVQPQPLTSPPPPTSPPAQSDDGQAPPAPGSSSAVAPAAAPAAPMAPPSQPASDHDAVVGHWGIEARRIAAAPFPLALQSPSGCPTSTTVPATPCTVEMGAISARHWQTRNLAWNAGLAFALGGGKQGSMALDTYYGVGPIVGLTLLLANWRHLAIGASPEASYVYFKPSGGSSPSTKLIALRAQLEGELHFGFVDVPALSVGITTGLVFQYESAPGVSTWSVSTGEARSIWGTLSNIFIRYYL